METRSTSCFLCGRKFEASHAGNYCGACIKALHALEHRHSLSIDCSSLEEFNLITSQLAQVHQPAYSIYSSHHSCFSRSSPNTDTYRLCYYYDQISIHLLQALVSLRNRYTLHDVVEHRDSLRFWPDYAAPQGVFATLLQSGSGRDREQLIVS